MKCNHGKVFTTAECARITSLSTRTIVLSIEKGLLEAYTHPGVGKHRRVTRQNLLKFIETHNLPMDKSLLNRHADTKECIRDDF